MGFTTPCLQKADSFFSKITSFPRLCGQLLARILLYGVLTFSFLTFSNAANAANVEGIQIKSAELTLLEESSYQVNAEFEINFSPKLEEAITKGVPVTFIVEFEINHPRWYWLDDELVKTQKVYKLSYNALIRQYQLSEGTTHKNFSNLSEAKAALSNIQDWPVFDRSLIKKNNTYKALLRMRLDVSLLPKPLQVNALASKDWNLDSDWYRWTLPSDAPTTQIKEK
ncbi:DUF4390 domain-containing protein [Sulfurirhabdus autotrophica]|uniref:Uncharacterized protein DUF4390 n=1 Tax=Sulfurirhabdus autotrophica TaxID=1706046 RepID=A0A4R3XVZ3_9PROT|nr:DUF4390 domain-containing protein [Sulfurirhabdus autotrophica]TCV80253.1 uncharacterized protein DUF4390 [Sulfurirhabdus autotrophica]